MYAYCWASGEIGFDKSIPNGALPIKKNCSKRDIEKIQVRSRLSYDGKTHLVPGIPEAENQDEAYEALQRFKDFVNMEKKK